MGKSIIPQSVLAERVEAQRTCIARVTGVLALAIQGAQELQGPVAKPEEAEDIEQALQIAHDALYRVYCDLEATEMVLFKPEKVDDAEVRS